MPPYMGGGDMISSVTFERTHLERVAVQVRGGHAATSPASIGLHAALDYIDSVGFDAIAAHERELLRLRHRGPAERFPACG